jgi:hypothetical protein
LGTIFSVKKSSRISRSGSDVREKAFEAAVKTGGEGKELARR